VSWLWIYVAALIAVFIRPALLEQMINLSLLLALMWLVMKLLDAALGRSR
jgi:hypothetical protein